MTSLSIPNQFQQNGYDFQIVQTNDIKLLENWLSEPHLVDWWTPDPDTVKAAQTGTIRFIVSYHDRPFAFIQCYDPSQDVFWEDNPQPSGTYGIDQFIGDPQMIGFGHGTKFIIAFTAMLKTIAGVHKIITSPAEDNRYAIKCYKQVGFRKEQDITTPDGAAVLMTYTAMND